MTRRIWLCFVISLFALTVAVAEPLAPGTYKGKYEGSAGSSGDFKVALSKAGEEWKGDVTFSLGGQEVKCTVKTVQVTGAKLKMVYSFDLQGTPLESQIDGELTGGKLAGKYRTQVSGDGSAVDEGTFTTTAAN